MKLSPYLVFNGQCREAFALYAQVLDGTVTMMMSFGESPMAAEMPPAQQGLILHASIELEPGRVLLGSDAPPERYQRPQGLQVTIAADTADEAKRVFAALSDGAQIVMPLGPTFWSAQFGMLVDRFGIPWMVNCQEAAA